MGKIRPKLSQAMQRELEVRRQLGLRIDDAKAQGPDNAERARNELARRRRYARRCRAGWDDLCYELQDMVLAHLSIADLSAARMAGLGAASEAGRLRLRDIMRARVVALKPLWTGWRKGTPRYQAQSARAGCTPIEFSSSVSKMCFFPRHSKVPESISEMRALRCLDISRHPSPFFATRLTTLPRGLACCQGLLELRITDHQFVTIPECVLELKNLRRLDLEDNVRLVELPADMGTRLSKLTFVDLRGCRLIKALPASLLRTLERSVSRRRRHRMPLKLGRVFFPEGYLEETLTAEEYPKLESYFRSGALTSQHYLFNDMIEVLGEEGIDPGDV